MLAKKWKPLRMIALRRATSPSGEHCMRDSGRRSHVAGSNPVPRRLTCTPSHSDLYAKVQFSPYLQLSFRSVRLHEQTCNFGGLMFALVALVSPCWPACQFSSWSSRCPMATNILVVDDNPAIRHSLRSRIEDETDWKVCEAENGKVAVDMVQTFCPDVIILDLSMPVMNGLDAAREISEIAPKAHILLFTLHSSTQLLEDARNAGVNDVLSKSEAGGTVVHAIRSLLAA